MQLLALEYRQDFLKYENIYWFAYLILMDFIHELCKRDRNGEKKVGGEVGKHTGKTRHHSLVESHVVDRLCLQKIFQKVNSSSLSAKEISNS